MRKQSQQPTMDEGLLDSLHGWQERDEEKEELPEPSDFLNFITFQYVSFLERKQRPGFAEGGLRRFISRAIWTRILIIRCRLLVSTLLPLIDERPWAFLEALLAHLRLVLHYVGFFLHGSRLILNIWVLIEPFFTEEKPLEVAALQFEESWFELSMDAHWLTSFFVSADYLMLSCFLLLLELGLFALRGGLEYYKLKRYQARLSLELEREDLPFASHEELLIAQAHAEAMLAHTKEKLILNLSITSATTLLFILKHLLIPAFLGAVAANPVFPFVFAVLALVVSLANHFLGQELQEKKPKPLECYLSRRDSFFYKNKLEIKKEIDSAIRDNLSM